MLEPDLSTLDISLDFVLSIDICWQVGDKCTGTCPDACVDQTFVSLNNQRHQCSRRTLVATARMKRTLWS